MASHATKTSETLSLGDIRNHLQKIDGDVEKQITEIRSQSHGRQQALIAELSAQAAKLRQQNPEIQGNYSAVLLHHFGSRSIEPGRSEAFESLNTRLIEAADEGDVPVLVAYLEEMMPRHAFAIVPRTNATRPFRSSVSVSSEWMHAFTNEHADVETRRLTLVGKAASIYDGFESESADVKTEVSELVISESIVALNGRGSSMSMYAFSNSVSDDVMNYSGKQSDRHGIFVGWKEIDGFLSRHGRDAYATLLKITESLAVQNFGPGNSRLSKIIKNLRELNALTGHRD